MAIRCSGPGRSGPFTGTVRPVAAWDRHADHPARRLRPNRRPATSHPRTDRPWIRSTTTTVTSAHTTTWRSASAHAPRLALGRPPARGATPGAPPRRTTAPARPSPRPTAQTEERIIIFLFV